MPSTRSMPSAHASLRVGSALRMLSWRRLRATIAPGGGRRVLQSGRSVTVMVMSLASVLGLAGCDLSGLVGKQPLPPGVSDPKSLNTPSGAVALYNTAVFTFLPTVNLPFGGTAISNSIGGTPFVTNGAFVGAVLLEGLQSDELQPLNLGGPTLAYVRDPIGFGTRNLNKNLSIDGRNVSSAKEEPLGSVLYGQLQTVRAASNQALGALAKYAPALSPALRGHLFALQGYAEIFLADIYCSGVPLTTLDFEGDFTYRAGSTTGKIYEHAVTRFDSAVAISGDSARILNLARVGRGRALLALGQYAAAATAVAAVPDTFAYQFLVNWEATDPANVDTVNHARNVFLEEALTVSDSEGINGIGYIRNGDARSAVIPNDTGVFGRQNYFPRKYGPDVTSTSAITVANGVEARLIEAEAALKVGDLGTWLQKLNRARLLATPVGAAPLAVLTDPGADQRETLLFRERALDLFVTGHRQGDMRRLVRVYGRDPETVYPTGTYPGYNKQYETGDYGHDVNLPVTRAERVNPLFRGCLSRGA